ncbi:MAG TPA: MATE family efflux transporter [Clostridiales bacterium UBA8960]|jgi:putative MATE family efflux protein|nr:MATE family efflux transporter [Clostridiales bacterium UBA8960]
MNKSLNHQAIRKIWTLAWPVMVGQALHTVLVLTDMWFIARLGSTEAAAAGTGTSLLGVIQVLPALVSAGVVALVARYTGANDHQSIRKISSCGLTLSLIIGAVVTLISILGLEQLLWIFGDADATVLRLSKAYVGIGLIGIPFFFYNATSRAIVQATGDTKNPVKIFIFANIVNIVLDYVFIYIFHWGIEGAAYATVTSEIVAFSLMTGLVLRNIYESSFKLAIENVTLHLETVKRILRIGGFAVMQMITRPFTGLIMYRLVLAQGVAAGAAFGVGGRMFNFVFIFLAGLGTAMSVMVGQSLGKSDFEGAKVLVRQGLFLAALNMLIFAIPFYLFPHILIGVFVQDAEVVSIGVNYLRITYTGVLFAILTTVFGAAFSGAGDTFPPMLASLVGNWVIKIPLAYFLTTRWDMGPNGVWLAICLSVIAEAFVMAVWFGKGKWQHKKI